MNEFSARWLALREPFDAAARVAGLVPRFQAALPLASLVVDLAAGTGANVRYLAPRLGPLVRFRLVDNDDGLLATARRRAPPGVEVATMTADLARDLPATLIGANGVAGSALLDLVSHEWLSKLAELAAARHLPLLFALTVDGRHDLTPPDADDACVLAAFARDQQRDKGFGPALGGGATAVLADELTRRGARVATAPSDWRLASTAIAMLESVIDDIAEAAGRAEPARAPLVSGWHARRRSQIAAGALSLVVGHQDLLAVW